MRRRTFNLLTLLSLLLGIAVAGLWVRSVWWMGDMLVLKDGAPEFNTVSGISNESHVGIWITDRLSGPQWRIGRLGPSPTAWMPISGYDFPLGRGGYSTGGSLADWLLILLLSVSPIIWLVFYRRHHDPVGSCASCGYDLRASKDKCPECGATIPTVYLGQPEAKA